MWKLKSSRLTPKTSTLKMISLRCLSFVVFAGKVFQQIVGILMGTNCASLLADIFLYSYEADFIQSLFSTGRKQLASRISHTGTSVMFCP